MSEEEFLLCPNCKNFDSTRYRENPNVKGYCKEKRIALYRLDFNVCLDFSGLNPEKKEVVIKH